MTEKTRILILGGGYGGVQAAKKLAKHYRRNDSIEITLIDKNPYHTLMTELHEIAGSRTRPDGVQVSFAKIFGATKVNVVVDEILSLDFDCKELRSKDERYEYDYLIIGAGGAPEFFDIPGVQENCFTLWSLEDALRIRNHVEQRFRDAAKEPDPAVRARQLTFAIAGAGFTGVELAGELLEQRDVLCPRYHIDPEEVQVVLIEAKDGILPVLPAKTGRKAERRLRRMGCKIMLNSMISEAREGAVVVDGNDVITDTLVWTAGIHGGELTARTPLTHGHSARGECSVATPEGIHGMAGCSFDDDERYVVGRRGRILVNEYMQSVDFDNVYLVGDVIWYVEKEHVLPQVVETALQTAETAAKNIAATIDGKEREPFRSNYHGFMVSVGSRYGVAHVLGLRVNGFIALGIKHLINLHYLFGLAGLNACWEYVREEFLEVRNRRSMFHGHLAAKTASFWLLPLRVFLGVKWLIEGIKKVGEGWLNPGDEGLREVWTGAIRLPGVSFGSDATTAATADAATAATDVVAEGAAAVDYGEPIIEALGIYTWFAETVISASPLLAFLMQSAVVLAEIAIGAALIGGLFVFPAAAVSIGLGLVFIVSGWGTPELLWYIFAAIAVMGGAGMGFGLDHYTIPWLSRWWAGKRLARRTYLYTGEPRD